MSTLYNVDIINIFAYNNIIKGDDNVTSLTSTLNVNVDAKNKEDATAILKGLGLNMSTAINMFLVQIVKRNGIPFEVTNPTPKEEIAEVLKEVQNIINNPKEHPGYTNREDLKKALLSDE